MSSSGWKEAFFIMFYPSLKEVCEYAKVYNIIPVMYEYYADLDTPISVFLKLKKDNNCFLLESVEGSKSKKRYSFIGRNPFLIFKGYKDKVVIKDYSGEEKEYKLDPIGKLKELMEEYKSPKIPGFPSFTGGAVGFFSYDAVRLIEDLKNEPREDIKIPELHFLFTDEIIAFDHIRQKLIIIVNMHVKEDIEKQYERATKRIIEIQNELYEKRAYDFQNKDTKNRIPPQIESNMTEDGFCAIVNKAKEYIQNGDIFQVVLSQRFKIKTNVDPLNVYRTLRIINPSPYMYYLQFDEYKIVGASPEMLVRVEDGIITTCPIAGTRKRGKNDEEDEVLGKELLSDPKENAEHVMLVDLGRNDIGKVSEFGSVKVSRLKYLQSFSHVIHLVSDVTGILRKDKTPLDALLATIPAGTLTGAPKVRAMEIIDELENVKRGVYGGAICYLSFCQNLDSCITIRTAFFKDNFALIQAGAGIVADSIPHLEYEETKNKAKAMIKAIEEGDFI